MQSILLSCSLKRAAEPVGSGGGKSSGQQTSKKVKFTSGSSGAGTSASGQVPGASVPSAVSGKGYCINEMLFNLSLAPAGCQNATHCHFDHTHLALPLSLADKALYRPAAFKMGIGKLKQEVLKLLK